VLSRQKTLLLFLLSLALHACGPTAEEAQGVEAIVNKINTRCPVMIDSETRLEYLRVLPDPGLQYSYRLVNLSDIKDTLAFKNLLLPGLLAAMRTDPDLQSMRDKSYTIIHRYESAEGRYLMSVRILPADYKTP